MANIQMTDWLPFCSGGSPRMPASDVLDAIRQAVIRFCAETMIWRYECPTISTIVGVNTYQLEIPSHSQCVRPQPELQQPQTSAGGAHGGATLQDGPDMDIKPERRACAITPRSPNVIVLDRVPDEIVQMVAVVAPAASDAPSG